MAETTMTTISSPNMLHLSEIYLSLYRHVQ